MPKLHIPERKAGYGLKKINQKGHTLASFCSIPRDDQVQEEDGGGAGNQEERQTVAEAK